MTTEQAKTSIRSTLLADSVIQSMVVTGTQERIYPIELPTAINLPAISYSLPSNVLNAKTKIRVIRFRFVCWSDDPDESGALAAAVERVLSGHSSVSGVEISNTDPAQIIEQQKDTAELYSAIVDVIAVVKER